MPVGLRHQDARLIVANNAQIHDPKAPIIDHCADGQIDFEPQNTTRMWNAGNAISQRGDQGYASDEFRAVIGGALQYDGMKIPIRAEKPSTSMINMERIYRGESVPSSSARGCAATFWVAASGDLKVVGRRPRPAGRRCLPRARSDCS